MAESEIEITTIITVTPPNKIHHRVTWTGQERHPGGDIGYSTGLSEWQAASYIYALRKLADNLEAVLKAQRPAEKLQ